LPPPDGDERIICRWEPVRSELLVNRALELWPNVSWRVTRPTNDPPDLLVRKAILGSDFDRSSVGAGREAI
jgi:hypothetical protein